MGRIKVIIEDLRPILLDRINAQTATGNYIGDLLDELEEMDDAEEGGIINRIKEKFSGKQSNKPDEVTEGGTDVVESAGTEEQDQPTERVPGAARKSNAAQRHAEAIARGEIG